MERTPCQWQWWRASSPGAQQVHDLANQQTSSITDSNSTTHLQAQLVDSTETAPFLTSDEWAAVDTLVLPILDFGLTETTLTHILQLLRHAVSLTSGEPDRTIRVMIVTSGGEGPASNRPGQRPTGTGALWGLMRAARMELPSRVSVICMDTDAEGGVQIGSQAASELETQGGAGRSDEVAYRGNTRHCRRLKPSRCHAIGPVVLRLEKRGQLADMEVRASEHQPLSRCVSARESWAAPRGSARLCGGPQLQGPPQRADARRGGLRRRQSTPARGGLCRCRHGRADQEVHDENANPNALAVGDHVFGMNTTSDGMLRSRAVVPRAALARMPRVMTFAGGSPHAHGVHDGGVCSCRAGQVTGPASAS